MSNSFYSTLPAIKCYTYLGTTTLAMSYIASKFFSGASMMSLCGVQLALLGAQYYLSSYIIKLRQNLFYNTEEVKDGEILDAVNEVKGLIKEKTGQNYDNIKVYKYESNELNAFAVGLTKGTAAVYVSSELVENLKQYKATHGEASPAAKQMLEAVLAHEFGHIVGKHSAIGLASRSLMIMTDLVVDYLKKQAAAEQQKKKQQAPKKQGAEENVADEKEEKEEKPKSVSFYVAYAVATLFKAFGIAAISRQNEYMADAFAVQLGYGAALQHGLIAIHNSTRDKVEQPQSGVFALFSGTYHWCKEWGATHPSLNNRVMAIGLANHQDKAKGESSIWNFCKFHINESRSHFNGVNLENGGLSV